MAKRNETWEWIQQNQSPAERKRYRRQQRKRKRESRRNAVSRIWVRAEEMGLEKEDLISLRLRQGRMLATFFCLPTEESEEGIIEIEEESEMDMDERR